MSNLIDFDFEAAIAQKNKFASKPAVKQIESSVDLTTAKMLSCQNTKETLQAIRLLVVVEKTNYSAYLSDLMTVQASAPEQNTAPVSHTDAQILNAASAWSQQVQEVAIFSCYSDTDYSEVCPLGIRLMGSGFINEEALWGDSVKQAKKNEKKMRRLVADFCPTHIIMTTPNAHLLSWANRHRINSIVLLSNGQAPLGKHHHKAVVKQLNHSQVRWIGSKGVSACKWLESKGVMASKLVPWEWPMPHNLHQCLPKKLDGDRDYTQLFYAGSLANSSGVNNLLAALSSLQQSGHSAKLEILIDETTPELEIQRLAQQAQQLAVLETVTISLTGSIEQLLAQVRDADVVVIPGYESETETPETAAPIILQVAMAACTPIVACDRPDLKDFLIHGVNAMIFPAGNGKSIAHRIERLMGQPQLYAQLSKAGSMAQHQRSLAVTWNELIERWMGANLKDEQWLKNYTLSSGRYPLPAAFVA